MAMSNISFQRGEILTASKLNALVQAVTGEASVGAASDVGLGGDIPVQTHQVQQREFSSYVPVQHPIYVDKTSPHWPLAGGTEGWFWRDSATASLTRLPVQPEEGCQLYLNTCLSPWGEVLAQTVTTEEAPGSGDWNPVTGKAGIATTLIGAVVKDIYKVGTKASTLRFFEAPASPVIPFRLFSVPGAPGTPFGLAPGTSGAFAPGTYWQDATLLDQKRGNAQIISRISSDGGILILDKYECTNGLYHRDLQLIPRLAIAAAPGTEEPISPCITQGWTQPAPGTWHEIASTTIAGQKLSLNMQWTNPWFAYMNLSATTGCSLPVGSAALEKMAWQGETPVVGQNPHGLGPWKRVSYTPNVVNMNMPHGWNCSYTVYDYAVYEAPGTYAPGTVAPGSPGDVSQMQRVLWVAMMRREVSPEPGDWVQFDKTELTAPLS